MMDPWSGFGMRGFRSALRGEEAFAGYASQGFAALHPGLFSFPPYGRNGSA
jgi:hypothetical protein